MAEPDATVDQQFEHYAATKLGDLGSEDKRRIMNALVTTSLAASTSDQELSFAEIYASALEVNPQLTVDAAKKIVDDLLTERQLADQRDKTRQEQSAARTAAIRKYAVTAGTVAIVGLGLGSLYGSYRGKRAGAHDAEYSKDVAALEAKLNSRIHTWETKPAGAVLLAEPAPSPYTTLERKLLLNSPIPGDVILDVPLAQGRVVAGKHGLKYDESGWTLAVIKYTADGSLAAEYQFLAPSFDPGRFSLYVPMTVPEALEKAKPLHAQILEGKDVVDVNYENNTVVRRRGIDSVVAQSPGLGQYGTVPATVLAELRQLYANAPKPGQIAPQERKP